MPGCLASSPHSVSVAPGSLPPPRRWAGLIWVLSPRPAPLPQVPSLRSQQMARALSPGSHTPRLLPHEKRCQSVWHRWAGRSAPCRRFPGTDLFSGRRRARMGRRHLAWFGDADTIHVAHLAPGATTFTEATPVPIPAGEVPIDIRLAVTSGGEAVTAVSAFGQDGSGIWVHSLARDASTLQLVPGSATGGAVDHGSFDAMGHGSAVNGADIVTSGGDVYVAWQQIASGATPQAPQPITVKTAKRLIGGPAGRFNPPIPIETIQQAGFVSAETLLAAGGGHVYVTWHRPDTQGRGVIGYTDLTLADTVHVISTDPDPNIAFAAADGGGTLIVTGSADPSGTRDSLVYAAVVAPGATSATAVELTPPGPVRGPEALAVAPDGDALILPDRVPDSEGQLVQIQASHRAPGGSFGPIEDVSGVQDGGGGSNNAAVAIGPDGTELAVWLVTDADGTLNDRIHLSQRDATPPQFTAVTVPSTVAVGAALRLTASATDPLTGPASIRWDFGDGSQSTGNTVTHAFGSPGVRTITVTATDTAGNTVTQTRDGGRPRDGCTASRCVTCRVQPGPLQGRSRKHRVGGSSAAWTQRPDVLREHPVADTQRPRDDRGRCPPREETDRRARPAVGDTGAPTPRVHRPSRRAGARPRALRHDRHCRRCRPFDGRARPTPPSRSSAAETDLRPPKPRRRTRTLRRRGAGWIGENAAMQSRDHRFAPPSWAWWFSRNSAAPALVVEPHLVKAREHGTCPMGSSGSDGGGDGRQTRLYSEPGRRDRCHRGADRRASAGPARVLAAFGGETRWAGGRSQRHALPSTAPRDHERAAVPVGRGAAGRGLRVARLRSITQGREDEPW